MSSIQDRIAALNMGHVGRVPGATPPKPLSLSQPAPPPLLPRSNSTEERATHALAEDAQTIGNRPNANPSRPPPPQRPEPKLWAHCASGRSNQQPAARPKPPPLPSRDSQVSISRRDSQDSVASSISTRSSLSLPSTRTSTSFDLRSIEPTSRVKAPVYDASKLPPLPPSRRDQTAAATAAKPSLPARIPSSTSIKSLSNTAIGQTTPPPRLTNSSAQAPASARPGLPPRPPPRTQTQQQPIAEEPPKTVPFHHRAQSDVQPRPTPAIRSALSYGLNKSTEATPPVPSRPDGGSEASAPPVPLSSRPDLAALQASKPKLTSTPSYTRPAYYVPPTTTTCYVCRDWSGPDNHAARFPRQGLPTQDLSWLGTQLTAPFSSLTDKARAVFIWLHYNIAYNTEAFFANNVKPSTPASTLATGLSVCEGYAALFVALATYGGLEAVVIVGHGKGFGYVEGAPLPAGGPTGHAWAAVKIDDGVWKLCDPCWGAGHVDEATKAYTKAFNPAQLTMTNEEFGERHYPDNPRHFYVARPPTFEQYWKWGGPDPPTDSPGEDVQIYSGCESIHGIGEKTVLPRKRHINMRGLGLKSIVQFRFGSRCEHWDHKKMGTGPAYVFVLSIGGVDGRKKDIVPFKHDAEYRHWWLDLPVEQLGCPGQSVSINYVTTVGGEDARGWETKRVVDAKGRKGMSWSGVASWQLI